MEITLFCSSHMMDTRETQHNSTVPLITYLSDIVAFHNVLHRFYL